MADVFHFQQIWGAAVNYPAGATFGPRRLDCPELVWIIQGHVTYIANGQAYTAPPGTIILARQGFEEAYQWDPHHQTRHAFFHLQGMRTPDSWGPQDDWPIVRQMPDHDIIRPLFRYVLAQLAGLSSKQATPMLVSSVQTLMGAFITGTLSQRDEGDRQLPVAVSRAVAYIRDASQDRPREKLQLKQIAKAAAVSPEHLCRLFREHLQVGPMEAVRCYRLDRAVNLISRSNLSIKEIADRCGFASPYHFSRVFQQTFKQSPTQVRKRVLAGAAPPMHPLAMRMQRLG